MEITQLVQFYNEMNVLGKFPDFLCIVFVSNDSNNFNDNDHLSECVTSHERAEIVNAFRAIANFVISYKSETEFIQNMDELKRRFKYVLVYSMAQNTNGIGRRCLIPLLCEHFNLYNISADFYTSVLGGNKVLMHELVKGHPGMYFPITYIYENRADIHYIQHFYNNLMNFMVKPNSESASIGVNKINVREMSIDKATEIIQGLYNIHGTLIFQQYITGKEVEVPVIAHKGSYFTPEAIEIVFPEGSDFLDSHIVANESYDFNIYRGPHKEGLITAARHCAKLLRFSAISRIDFRVNEENYYIMDITPNPTISSKSSTHVMFENLFNGDQDAAYKMLVFEAVRSRNLLEPSFNPTK
ncbi:hypothetical protein [Paenibacillus sp. FSL H8-0034]|uniref:hypothetical protein n=1 Tax=Paenibacillus sp. FSL H8-0034 TaxID=2954671 RepID=UPI0030FAA05E